MKKFIITAGLVGSLLLGSQVSAASSYTVKSGDFLWKIASENNATVQQIIQWNGLTSATIYPGQVLKVSEDTVATTKYTVKSGDTLYIISQKLNTTISALQMANPQLTNPNMLYIGQVLNIPTKQSSPVKQVTGQDIINTGNKYIGAGYLYGASTTRTDVFDCSSFIKRVYEENGIYVPRITVDQANSGTTIPFSQAQPGDIVSFDNNFDGRIDHTGLYVNATTILHASSSVGVTYSNISYYWKDRLVKVTRVLN